MATHRLKLNSDYYNDSASGIKTFEIRKNDRKYQVGDILELREWVWSDLEQKGAYTGEVHWKVITYILEDTEYLQDGYVCLAVAPIAEVESVATAGEWIEAKSGVMSVYPSGQVMCSICKQRMPAQWKKMPPYCYGCGAKMEESNIDEEGEG